MRILKIAFFTLLGLGTTAFGIYQMGPRPLPPLLLPPTFLTIPSTLDSLEMEIAATEAAEPGIKPGCAAHIVWADSTKKVKTPVAFLYLHGFGASHEEGAPVPANLAKTFGANLYLARMSEHGVEEGDGNLCTLTADSYYQSAEKALHIAQQLGDSVIILATSGGGALGLFLCSRHPEVKSIVTWSPAIQIADPAAVLLSGPWGMQLARLVRGTDHNEWPYRKPEQQKKYWTNHQCWAGVIQFSLFLKHAMTPLTFAQIKCPVFIGYYYENEEKQDKLVSVAAMKTMSEMLGTPAEKRRMVNFPKAADHVIASQILSSDWQGVERESTAFLQEICGLGRTN
jgi:pimeloyl-ACP methyl ester carboxylesterase